MLAEAKKRQYAAKNSTDESIIYVREEAPDRKIWHAKKKKEQELEDAKLLEAKARAALILQKKKEQDEELDKYIEWKHKKQKAEIERKAKFFAAMMTE